MADPTPAPAPEPTPAPTPPPITTDTILKQFSSGNMVLVTPALIELGKELVAQNKATQTIGASLWRTIVTLAPTPAKK